ARPIEAGLARLARHPRLRAPLAAPAAPWMAAALLAGVAVTAAVALAWETLSLLRLRPYAVSATWLGLLYPCRRGGRALATFAARLRAPARPAALAGVAVMLFAVA